MLDAASLSGWLDLDGSSRRWRLLQSLFPQEAGLRWFQWSAAGQVTAWRHQSCQAGPQTVSYCRCLTISWVSLSSCGYMYVLIASLGAQTVKSPPATKETAFGFDPWVGKIPWRRKWQPTAVFFPGESHGQRSLVGYSPWGRKESDLTEWLILSL